MASGSPSPSPNITAAPTANSIFAELSDKIPRFETRKALLIMNMQNDTFDQFGDFYMCRPHDFRSRLTAVVPYFRSLGEVVWVSTELADAPPAAVSPEPARLKKNAPRVRARAKREPSSPQPKTPSSAAASREATPSAQQIFEDSMSQYHPTSRSKAAMRKATPEAQAKLRSEEYEGLSSDFDLPPGSRAGTPGREGPSAAIYRAGTPGAALTADAQAVLDRARDLVLVKHHHSAFDATALLVSLRMKLVTHLYLAGALTNVSVLATARDAARHGFAVSVVEDCLGYRSEAKHVEAMRKMADELGVAGVDSEEIMDMAGGRRPPDAQDNLFTGPGLSGISGHDAAAPPPKRRSTTTSSETGEGRDSKRTKEPAVEGSSPKDSSVEGNEQSYDTPLPSVEVDPAFAKKSRPRVRKKLEPMLGPGDSIGEGDSKILVEALSETLAEGIFELVRDEVDWQAMYHRSGEVPRRVAVQGEIDAEGAVPIYRHPADESPPLLRWTPAVLRIRDELQLLLKQPFNHALIQLYRSGQDFISEHSDKTLDVIRGSSIINMSLGAQRTMTLRTKKSAHAAGGPDESRSTEEAAQRLTQRIPMPHNSVFVLGSRTNAKWLHGVRPDKRPAAERLHEEKAFGGARISLTFRHIGTFTDAARARIWGQGAVSKIRAAAGHVATADGAEMEAMVVAFGKENQQSDFDWDAEYGRGFDTLNLVVKDPAAAASRATLYLCGDALSNRRVALAVRERGIPCHITRARPPPRDPAAGGAHRPPRRTIFALAGDENPLLRDADTEASETLGDLAILFYISKFYPPGAAGLSSGAAAGPDDGSAAEAAAAAAAAAERGLRRTASNVFSRVTQANELLFLWQELARQPLSASTRATHQMRRLSAATTGTAASSAAATETPPGPPARADAGAVATAADGRAATAADRRAAVMAADGRAAAVAAADRVPAERPAEAFEAEMEVWDEYVEEAAFAGGPVFSVVDAAFWPLLDEVVGRWAGWRPSRYANLAGYWRRVGAMECTQRALRDVADA